MSKYISLVPKVFFGEHCEEDLERLIKSKRTNYTAPFIFIVDDVFENNKAITQILPVAYEDKIYYISSQEAFTSVFIDELTEKVILDSKDKPLGIIALGGSYVIQLGKIIAAMLNNPGSVKSYFNSSFQTKAVFHVGIPVISSYGTEVSQWLTINENEETYTLNSSFLTYDYLFYDIDLSKALSLASHFLPSMVSYINASMVVSSSSNIVTHSHSSVILNLIKEVYLAHNSDAINNYSRCLSASWYAGLMQLRYEKSIMQVLAIALNYVTDIPVNTCMLLIFDKFSTILKKEVRDFKAILIKNAFVLPKGEVNDLDAYEFEVLINQVYKDELFWNSDIGKYWNKLLPKKEVIKLFKKL